ncbi:MAG: hypothetical protein K2Q45_02530 [Nitrosomonas sp.]|nr:hypothetical protein [Nitrosomonas sp.]
MDSSLSSFIITSLEEQRKRIRSVYERDTEISWQDRCRYLAYTEQFKDDQEVQKTLELLLDPALQRSDQDGTAEGFKNRMLVMYQKKHIDQLQAKIDQMQILLDEQGNKLVMLEPIREILSTLKMYEENILAITKENERLESESKRSKTAAEESAAYQAVLFRKEAEDRRQKRLVVINEGHAKLMALLRSLHESLLVNKVYEKDINHFRDEAIKFIELVRLQNEF